MPVQVRGEVLDLRRAGAYHALTLVAPGIAEQTRPGHFVALAVGGEDTSMLLRRSFSVYRVQERGVYVTAFSYPVVPQGKARIRTQISAAHTREDLEFALEQFAAVRRELGLG